MKHKELPPVMSTPHDHLPKSTNTDKDMSAEDLQFLHAAPSHENTSNSGRRRNMLIGGGTVAGLVAAGALYLGFSGNDKDPQRTDVQPAPTSQSAEPTPSIETPEPTQELSIEEPTPVTVEEYPTALEAAPALHEELEKYINSGIIDYDQGGFAITNDEYLKTTFGSEPYDDTITELIEKNYDVYAEQAAGGRGSLNPEYIDQSEYHLSLNRKNVELISQSGDTAIVRMTVNASHNLPELREKEFYSSYEISGLPLPDEGYEPNPHDALHDNMTKWVTGNYTLKIVNGAWIISNITPVK